jgi:hypothetical protein
LVLILVPLGFVNGQTEPSSPSIFIHDSEQEGFRIFISKLFIDEFIVDSREYNAGDTIKTTFLLVNEGEEPINNARCRVSLGTNLSGDNKNTEKFYLGDYFKVSLKSKSEERMNLQYKLPDYVAAEDSALHVECLSSQGRSLNDNFSSSFSIVGTSKTLNISSAGILTDPNQSLKDSFSLDSEPIINSNRELKEIYLGVNLKNELSQSLEITPVIEYRDFLKGDLIIKEQELNPFVLESGSQVTKSFVADTFNYEPGVYIAKLIFVDSEGNLLSRDLEYRYVVGGELVSLDSADLEVRGSKIKLDLSYSSGIYDFVADLAGEEKGGNSSFDATFKVELFNENDELILSSSKDVITKDGETLSFEGEALVSANNVKAKVTVFNQAGDLLDEQEFNLSRGISIDDQKDYKNILIILGIILFVIIILLAIRSRMKQKDMLVSIVLTFFVFSTFLFGNTETVFAGTSAEINGLRSEYFPGETIGINVSHKSQVCANIYRTFDWVG